MIEAVLAAAALLGGDGCSGRARWGAELYELVERRGHCERLWCTLNFTFLNDRKTHFATIELPEDPAGERTLVIYRATKVSAPGVEEGRRITLAPDGRIALAERLSQPSRSTEPLGCFAAHEEVDRALRFARVRALTP